VYTIILRCCKNITVEGIRAVKDVHKIWLTYPKEDSWLKHLCNVHSVTIGYGTTVTNDGFRALINVKCLELYHCVTITDLAFETLVNLEQLKLIRLGNITNGCLKYLKSLTRLISVGCTGITKEVVESFWY